METEIRLTRLAAFLRRAAGTRWEVGYGEAEGLAGEVARRLGEVLSAQELAVAEWRGIPRGGLIVLGMLAYQLDLPRHRLHGGIEAAAPLVLVDDCALSGLRLRQTLDALAAEPGGEERPVVVAHLVSAPQLRRAVEEAEPRVRACVAAADLEDRAEELYPDPEARRTWRRRWEERLAADRRYWLGMPRMVSFPWGEPDRPFWNDALERMEDGWRFVPPHRCLKNRAALARALPATPAAGPFWQMADGVVWGDFDGVLWLCHTGSEQVFSLDGTARWACRALLTGRGSGGAAAVLAARYEVDPAQAREDVDALVADLRRCGLLVPAEAPSGTPEPPQRGVATGSGTAGPERPAPEPPRRPSTTGGTADGE